MVTIFEEIKKRTPEAEATLVICNYNVPLALRALRERGMDEVLSWHVLRAALNSMWRPILVKEGHTLRTGFQGEGREMYKLPRLYKEIPAGTEVLYCRSVNFDGEGGRITTTHSIRLWVDGRWYQKDIVVDGLDIKETKDHE